MPKATLADPTLRQPHLVASQLTKPKDKPMTTFMNPTEPASNEPATDRPPTTFFLSQRTGRWKWPWLLASLPAAAFAFALTLLLIVFGIEGFNALGFGWAADAKTNLDGMEDVARDPAVFAVQLLAIGLPFWAAAVTGSYVHRRPAGSLVAPLTGFRWPIVWKALAFIVPAFLLSNVFLFLPRGGAQFTGFEQAHLVWLLPLALLTLVQTSGEDVFFKGYLLRQVGAATKVFWFAPIVVVAFFVAGHVGNPDWTQNVWLMLSAFVASEFVIIYLLIRTGGLEVPLALHWANNTLIFLLIAERTTQANDLSLVVFDEGEPSLTEDFITTGLYFVYLAAMLAAFTWRRSPLYLEKYNYEEQNAQAEPPAAPQAN